MLIRFSTDKIEGLSLSEIVRKAAKLVWAQGEWASAAIAWERNRRVRFRLVRPNGDDASFDFHDRFFAALYDLDPLAEIRTAQATYLNRDDFNRQVAAEP